MKRALVSFLVALLAASATFVVLLPAAPAAPAATATPYSSHPERVFYDQSGDSSVVEKLNVSLTVSSTRDLRNRQQLDVSWTGAHPTGGIATNPNSGTASGQEYPMVLMECRGVGAAVRPETCWTSTAQERYQLGQPLGFEWPVWRSDGAATAADRARVVDAPSPIPSDCQTIRRGAERWVQFDAADGKVYAGGSLGCAGMAPEASAQGDVGLPSNTTYAVTGLDGNGRSRFTVATDDDNESLGCSSSVACSLVAVPIVGISCDAWATQLPATAPRPSATDATEADTDCRAADTFQPGEHQTGSTVANLATSGALWWSASNWDSRIQVPLTFALSPNICGVVNKTAPLSVYGSIGFSEVSAQWAPKFCTTTGYKPFVHVQTADSAARTLVNTGGTSMALVSEPLDGGYARPVVQAPVAVTGFAVAFNIDSAQGERISSLKLDARLIAKLLSESYAGNFTVARNYPALAKNPLNITLDPEFQALNPGVPQQSVLEAASTLLTLNSDSDLMTALTGYLDQDTEARDFLNGVPDPWGMKVNPNYLHLQLPVSSWPLLDTFQPDSDSTCYNLAPAPYLGLIANPVGQLSTLIQDVQYAISNVDLGCSADANPNNPNTTKLLTQGRQRPGERFMLGLVPLSAAYRYGLDIAALQTTSSVKLGTVFNDSGGRAFVLPTDAALKAATAFLQPDTDAGLWTVQSDAFRTAAAERAYPGLLPIYAVAPTSGLDKATAGRISQFLSYASAAGQVAGASTGDLPQGVLPMTKANGLGALAAYSACAAKAVLAQRGEVPVVGASSCSLSAAPASASPTVTPGSAGPPAAPVITVPSVSVPPVGSTTVPAATTTATPLTTVAATTGFGRYGIAWAGFLAVLLLVFGTGLRFGDAIGRGALAAAGRIRHGLSASVAR